MRWNKSCGLSGHHYPGPHRRLLGRSLPRSVESRHSLGPETPPTAHSLMCTEIHSLVHTYSYSHRIHSSAHRYTHLCAQTLSYVHKHTLTCIHTPAVADFILGGSKITADGDCSHGLKRRLLLGRKVMTNLDSIFKSTDITLPTKVRLAKAVVHVISLISFL